MHRGTPYRMCTLSIRDIGRIPETDSLCRPGAGGRGRGCFLLRSAPELIFADTPELFSGFFAVTHLLRLREESPLWRIHPAGRLLRIVS